MQQMFQCPDCGSSNIIGRRFCGGCGTKFQYKCFNCGGLIDPAFRFCPDCHTRLEWLEPQSTQPMPVRQNTYYEPQSTSGYGRVEPQQYQERSSSPLKSLMLVVGIVLIVAGAIFAASSGSNRPSAPTPPVTSQLPIVTPIPKDNKTGTVTLPDPIQQYTDKQPPFKNASGRLINLVNIQNAKDASYDEIKSFILKDKTDDGIYVERVKICGDFAEMVHNNAEQNGIRAAFVAIMFENEQIGHALNAFQTTDKGLVYIDCTGQGPKTALELILETKLGACELDRVAYVELGREYGTIEINKATSLSYSFYIDYAQNWQKFDTMLVAYNKDVTAFNQTYASKATLPTAEYNKYTAWKALLEEKKRILQELIKNLGNCFSEESMGIVKTIRIYW
jgi:hypothetical protein